MLHVLYIGLTCSVVPSPNRLTRGPSAIVKFCVATIAGIKMNIFSLTVLLLLSGMLNLIVSYPAPYI